jgi:pimeloyl-ACP methyl ester carboxylesterase
MQPPVCLSLRWSRPARRGRREGPRRPLGLQPHCALNAGLDVLAQAARRRRVEPPGQRVALVGVSWGGLVAAAYAAWHPERVTQLVLLDAAPLDFTEFVAGQQRFSARVALLQRAGLIPDPVPADRDDSCLPSLTALLPAYLADPKRPPRAGIAGGTCTAGTAQATYTALRDRGGLSDLAMALTRYRGPALVIAGQRDPFGPGWQRRNLQLLAASGPDSLIVANAGRFTFAEQPKVVLPAIDRFLSG